MGIFKRKDSKFYWCRYSYRGRNYRESTGEVDEKKAAKYLRDRLDQVGADKIGARKFVGPGADRIVMQELFDSLKRDIELRGLRSYSATANHIDHAAEAFGEYRAREITQELVDKWVQDQLQGGEVAPSTLNRRLQMLRQALQLAVDRGQLAGMPKIRKLSELGRERKGFFSQAEIEGVITNSPDYLKDFIRFASLCGWRRGEIASLTWADVDLADRVIRLRPEHSKNAQGRILALEGELWAIIERAGAVRSFEQGGKVELSGYVFHRFGLKIGDFRKAWARACNLAGCPGRHFHDLRRTAVRNMMRSGVPQTVAMSISGHKTTSVFNRYNITSEQDQRDAQKRVQEHNKSQGKEGSVLSLC